MQTRRDEVLAELQRRVSTMEFSPQTRLVEERLAELLGVSRTPVREALVQLAAQGLVDRTPDGYFVSLPDLRRLRDLYELRLTLELRGLARAQQPGITHDEAAPLRLRAHWTRPSTRASPGPQATLRSPMPWRR
jgi:DNA-binding GntR family transcriptional regulator